MTNTVFQFNSATRAFGGGAAYISSPTLGSVWTNVQLIGNRAQSGDGGALFLDAPSVTLTNSVATGNSANGDGGAIAVVSVRSRASLKASNVQWTQNSAVLSGGALSSRSASVVVTGGLCVDNRASLNGGCVALTDSSTGTVSGLTIIRNAAGSGLRAPTLTSNGMVAAGGGVHCLSSALNILSSSIQSCNATDCGGGFAAVLCTVQFGRLNVTDCATATFGGAGYFGLFTDAIASSLSLAFNRAGQSGGALFVTQTRRAHLFDSTCNDNTAGQDGGALCFSAVTAASIKGLTLSRNTAMGNGGALAAFNSKVGVAVSTLSSNQAPQGGGGCYYWSGQAPTIIGRSCSPSNTALYGNDIATPITQLVVVWSSSSQYAGPLFPISPAVQVQARDAYQHVVLSDSTQMISVVPAPLVQGLSVLPLQGGAVTFSGLTLQARPGSYNLSVESSVDGVAPALFAVTVVDCPAGGFFNPNILACQNCTRGTAAPVSGAVGSCTPCGAGTVASTVGALVCTGTYHTLHHTLVSCSQLPRIHFQIALRAHTPRPRVSLPVLSAWRVRTPTLPARSPVLCALQERRPLRPALCRALHALTE